MRLLTVILRVTAPLRSAVVKPTIQAVRAGAQGALSRQRRDVHSAQSGEKHEAGRLRQDTCFQTCHGLRRAPAALADQTAVGQGQARQS